MFFQGQGWQPINGLGSRSPVALASFALALVTLNSLRLFCGVLLLSFLSFYFFCCWACAMIPQLHDRLPIHAYFSRPSCTHLALHIQVLSYIHICGYNQHESSCMEGILHAHEDYDRTCIGESWCIYMHTHTYTNTAYEARALESKQEREKERKTKREKECKRERDKTRKRERDREIYSYIYSYMCTYTITLTHTHAHAHTHDSRSLFPSLSFSLPLTYVYTGGDAEAPQAQGPTAVTTWPSWHPVLSRILWNRHIPRLLFRKINRAL